MTRRWTCKLQRWLMLTVLLGGSMSAGVWAANETTGSRQIASDSASRERSILVMPVSVEVPIRASESANEQDSARTTNERGNTTSTDLVFRPAPSLQDRANGTNATAAARGTATGEARQPIVPGARASSFAPPRLITRSAPPAVAPAPATPSDSAPSMAITEDASEAQQDLLQGAEKALTHMSDVTASIGRWSEATGSQLRGWIMNRWSPAEPTAIAPARVARRETIEQPVDSAIQLEGLLALGRYYRDRITSSEIVQQPQATMAAWKADLKQQLAGTTLLAKWEEYKANEAAAQLSSSRSIGASSISHRTPSRSGALWFAGLLDSAADQLKGASTQLEMWACESDLEDESCATE